MRSSAISAELSRSLLGQGTVTTEDNVDNEAAVTQEDINDINDSCNCINVLDKCQNEWIMVHYKHKRRGHSKANIRE